MASKAITIVISPLLSLIQDQIQNLLKKGVAAISLSSSQTAQLRNFVFTELSLPDPCIKLLYLTPEMMMRSEQFQRTLDSLIARNMIAR